VWTFSYLHHIIRPLPLTGEDFRRGSPVTVRARFGTLSAGLRTNHTTRGKHARVGTGRNMPGNPRNYYNYSITLNFATSCRTLTPHITGIMLRLSFSCVLLQPLVQNRTKFIFFGYCFSTWILLYLPARGRHKTSRPRFEYCSVSPSYRKMHYVVSFWHVFATCRFIWIFLNCQISRICFEIPLLTWTHNLTGTLYAGGTTIPCRQLGDLQPRHLLQTLGSSLRPGNASC